MVFSNKEFNRGGVELKTKDIYAYREQIALSPCLGFAGGSKYIHAPPLNKGVILYVIGCGAVW
jgi:hypothetical protein